MDIMSIESLQADAADFDDTQLQESRTELLNIEQAYQKRIEVFDQSYNSSELRNDENTTFEGMKKLDSKAFFSDVETSFCYQMGLCAGRNWNNFLRLP